MIKSVDKFYKRVYNIIINQIQVGTPLTKGELL